MWARTRRAMHGPVMLSGAKRTNVVERCGTVAPTSAVGDLVTDRPGSGEQVKKLVQTHGFDVTEVDSGSEGREAYPVSEKPELRKGVKIGRLRLSTAYEGAHAWHVRWRWDRVEAISCEGVHSR